MDASGLSSKIIVPWMLLSLKPSILKMWMYIGDGKQEWFFKDTHIPSKKKVYANGNEESEWLNDDCLIDCN